MITNRIIKKKEQLNAILETGFSIIAWSFIASLVVTLVIKEEIKRKYGTI